MKKEIFDFTFVNKDQLPFSKIVSFERVESDFELKIGDQVSLWNKPNTNQVNLYAKGSVGGDGLVGVTTNPIISHHLNNTEYLFVEAKVVDLTSNRINLFVNLYSDEKAVLDDQANQRAKWIQEIQKKYYPKSNWELRFFSENKIQKGNIKIKIISIDQINDFYHKQDEAIWLVDNDGLKLDVENRIRDGGTEKTLRAVFTGHKLEIKEFKKDHNWYYIIVGINTNSI